jgi:SAM-dependent methyltransferase
MRYRNKFNIDFSNNPLKKDPLLLSEKNRLEAKWYDDEANEFFRQLNNSGKLITQDKEFEDWFAKYFDNPSPKLKFHRLYHFFGSFPRKPDTQILELGFGDGCLSRFLLRRGFQVYSADVSIQYCRFLQKTDNRSAPVRTCAEILPFKDSSFEVVTAIVALHHFNLQLCLQEMNRVLKKGGLGIFIEPLCDSKLFYRLRQFVPIPDNESPGGGGIHKRELIEQLEKVGLAYEINEFEFLTRLERLPLMAKHQEFLRKSDYEILSKIPFLRRFARTFLLITQKS